MDNDSVVTSKCPSPQDIWQQINEPWQQYTLSQKIPTGSVVLINETQPSCFLAYVWAGLLAHAALVIANPNWQQQEWQQVAQLLSPDIVLGKSPPLSFGKSSKRPAPGQILIATGGTSGKIKFVIHTWATLTAAAEGFLEHFGQQQPVNSYCVLPLYHVSGLMQAMRVWLSHGQLVTQTFKHLEAGQRLTHSDLSWFISLVPTQLQRLLKHEETVKWLTQFRAILLGGAPAWPGLLAQAHQLPIALTYGMSETAAQVATLLPEEFCQGKRSNGAPLPHVNLMIHKPGSSHPQVMGSVGRIALQLPSLGLGYWPDVTFSRTQDWFYPDDLGYLDHHGHLYVIGRNSQKIITGGENVFPAEVETALLATGLVQDICVVGLSDQVWGQTVAALCVASAPSVTTQQLKTALEPLLSAYKHPKHWQMVDQIPRNAQGKVNRPQVVAWLTESTGLAQDSVHDADG